MNAFTDAFRNEVYLNFSEPSVLKAQKDAIDQVRSRFGKEHLLYVDGKWVKGEKGTFSSTNPSNISETIGHFQLASSEQARKAVDTAWRAFKTWQFVPAEKRAELAFRAADICMRRRYEINAWMVSEVGKNYLEADADMCEGVDFIRYYALDAVRLSKGMQVHHSWGDLNQTIYLPLGVGVSISPWNFPWAITLGMAIAPILAGNCVVAKPSHDSPMMATLIAEILHEAGFPAGVFNLVTGDNQEVGETLIQLPNIRFINFTGSLGVGQHLYEVAGQVKPGQHHLKRIVAELGGKNAVIVDEGADLEAAATGIVQAAFGFQGQKCSACSRVIPIGESTYSKLLDLVVAKTKALAQGDSKDNFAVGPVVSKKAFDKIREYIEIGKKEGRLMTGGGTPKMAAEGYYIEPTVFADIKPDARIAQEEIFGPVTAFIKANDLDEALAIANGTPFGLTGGFFSNNEAHIERALREFHVGNLYVNRKNTGALVGAQPFGGFNFSGTDGKAGGHDYLMYFLQAKSLTERPMKGISTQVGRFVYEKNA